MDFALEKLLLVIPTGSPREYTADIEILSENVSHHILWRNTLSGAFVVGATRCMDVVIPGTPALCCDMNPSFEMKGLFMRLSIRDDNGLCFYLIFWTSCVFDSIVARR